MTDLAIRKTVSSHLSSEEDRISLILYIDDFEVCKPLGSSRQKHKVISVNWVLGSIPTQYRSTLASIYLSILSMANDTKQIGFQKISGYPPDVLHDILKGIVPVELALSIDVLIKKRYISLIELNIPFVSSHTSGVIK